MALRAKVDPPGVRAFVVVAAGTAVGGLVLAWLDSPWTLLCAVSFFVTVMLLALYAGLRDPR